MKIAITGHTSGIGKQIYNYFKNNNEIIGFSKSNGYDISNIYCRQFILHESKNCDIFVNNAFCADDSQFILLTDMFEIWKNTNKIIINISSRYTSGNTEYCKLKNEQDVFCNSKVYELPYIINLKPGLINTRRVQNQIKPKMNLEEIDNILDFIINKKVKIHSMTFGL